ncbi:MAG: PAS domain S-box protein [Prolixibacteraceae bacterium]|jgi:PAS domain S-box-containing protein|nr:PAS domain S-box protein [Prolixibacteraceae bacterium]
MKDRAKTNDELTREVKELQERYNSLAATVNMESKNKTVNLLVHAVRCISECVSITDMDNKIIFVNKAFLKTYQYEEHELLGKNISMVRSPNNNAELVEVILPSTLEGGWQGELLNRRKDGTDFYVFVSSSIIRDYSGRPLALIGVTSEKTEQKKLELERQAIIEMTQGISETDNLNELFLSIHLSLKKVLYAENCFVAIYDEHTGLFNFPYYIDQLDPKPDPQALKRSVTSYVFRTGKPLLLTPEVSQILEGQNEIELIGSPSPSWIGVPLKTPSKTIGVLVLQHYEKENIYSTEDIQFLNSVGTKIAISVERKKVEEELRNERLLLRTVIDNIPDSIYSKDMALRKTLSNRTDMHHCKVKSEAEILGKTDFDLHPKELAEGFYADDQLVLRSGQPLLNKEEYVVLKNGQKQWQLTSKIPLKDKNGNVTGLIGIGRDITNRRLAEEALRESENIMRSITDSAYDAIIMIDSEGLISYWNPAAERIFGYNRSEAMGVNLHHLIVPSSYNAAHFSAFPIFQQMGQGATVGKTMDLEALRKDGTEIIVQFSLSAIQINNKWHAVGVLRDITDQKKIEQALVKAKQEAEMANKFKSIFLANMSHEIRTPLNAIIGFSQLINRDKMLSDSQKEYNVSIIHAGEHLLSLINDILELSKIEAGRVVLNPADMDLFALLDDIQMIFTERTQSKNLQFLFDKDDDLPQYIFVDEAKLRQIFVNLIGNALKFTEEGGIAVRARVDSIGVIKKMLVVEVQDSGPGIPMEEMDKLFKHFEQTSSGINKGSGTGLGLALSRELALLMGGDITVNSEVGRGSIFTFQVEIKDGNADAIEKSERKGVIGIESSNTTYRILVVDDRNDNLKVASNLLKLVGFETEEAVNGEEAIEKFESWSPHLILMDMRMPVMDGYEATRRIKATEKGQKTPIVALTASTFEDELKKIQELGMQGYIRKPFRENDLFNTIGKILGINYIYENVIETERTNYSHDTEAIALAIKKIPNSMLLKMQNALDVADLDLLVQLINTMEADNSELSKLLLNLATDYDYDQLQGILHIKEKMG